MVTRKKICIIFGVFSFFFLSQGCQPGWKARHSQSQLGHQQINQENSDYSKWLNKSNESLQKGSWAEAIRTASVAVRLKPGMPDGYINRAWAYNEKEMYDLAISDCNKALDVNPGNVAATNNRGVAYLGNNDKKRAQKDFRRACEKGLEAACNNFKEIAGYLPTEESKMLAKLIEDNISAEDHNEVITLTSQIIELEPKNVDALTKRCGARANLEIFDKAISDCRKAIRMNPDYAMAYHHLGYILKKQGKTKEADLSYEMSCGLGNAASCDNLEE